MEYSVKGNVEFYREKGHWCMLVRAPEWVLNDLVRELGTTPRQLRLANHGGTETQSSALFVVNEPGTAIGAEFVNK